MGIEAAGLVLFLGLMFGSMSVIARYMLQQFDPMTFTAIRLALAALVFLIIYGFRIRGRTWPVDKRLWARSILFGIIGDAIQIILFISALKYLSAGLTSILSTFFPVVTVLLAHFLLSNERMSRQTGMGVVLGMAGAVLIVMLGETGLEVSTGSNLKGYVLILVSGLIMSFGIIYARKYMMSYDTYDTVFVRIISAALTASIMALILEPGGIHQVTNLGIILLIYAGAVYFVGFLLTFYVLKRFGVTVSAIVSYIPPIVASILGMVFLGEKITPGMVIGMILILSGVAVINFVKKKPALPAEKLQIAE